MHFSAIFVSSSTTDGLLRNGLSGGGPYWWGPGSWPPAPPLNPTLDRSGLEGKGKVRHSTYADLKLLADQNP